MKTLATNNKGIDCLLHHTCKNVAKKASQGGDELGSVCVFQLINQNT